MSTRSAWSAVLAPPRITDSPNVCNNLCCSGKVFVGGLTPGLPGSDAIGEYEQFLAGQNEHSLQRVSQAGIRPDAKLVVYRSTFGDDARGTRRYLFFLPASQAWLVSARAGAAPYVIGAKQNVDRLTNILEELRGFEDVRESSWGHVRWWLMPADDTLVPTSGSGMSLSDAEL